MSYACPITFEKVDSTVSRFSSFFVSGVVVYYLYTSNLYVLYFLFLDFFMRIFCQRKFSPIYLSSVLIKKVLGLKECLSDSGAKKLAGVFGIFFVALLILLHQIDLSELSIIVGAVFITCSLLDALFNYCIGCKIYYLLKKIYPDFMS